MSKRLPVDFTHRVLHVGRGPLGRLWSSAYQWTSRIEYSVSKKAVRADLGLTSELRTCSLTLLLGLTGGWARDRITSGLPARLHHRATWLLHPPWRSSFTTRRQSGVLSPFGSVRALGWPDDSLITVGSSPGRPRLRFLGSREVSLVASAVSRTGKQQFDRSCSVPDSSAESRLRCTC